MPIVVYFVKRDVFILWCTHFVYKPLNNRQWLLSNRSFANFIRFVSYDRSSWLANATF